MIDRRFGRRRKPAVYPSRREEDISTKLLIVLDRLAGQVGDVAAGDPKIAEFAVGKAAQLVNRLPVTAPVTIGAHQVHFLARSLGSFNLCDP